jgi:hypothetical protein
MTLTKKVIPLAYVFSGASSITSIYVIEKTGKYIFARRQKGGPTVWTFDDFEDILNIGEAPTASFDSTSNKIYVDHVRNGQSYRRTIQVGTEGSAWILIPDYLELTGNILRPPDFVNDLVFSASGIPVIGSITNTFEQLYDTSTDSTIITKNSVLGSGLFSKTKTKFLGGTFFMSPSGLHGFNNEFLNPGYSNDFLVYLPYIIYIAPVSILNVTFYEVYGPDNATLLLSIPYSSFLTWYNLNAFVGTTLYFGWRGTVSVYPNGTSIFNFVLPDEDRIKLHSISNSNKVDFSPTQINTEPRDTVEDLMSSSLSIFNDIVTYTQALPSGNETEDSITINGTISGSGLPLVTALA